MENEIEGENEYMIGNEDNDGDDDNLDADNYGFIYAD